MMKRLNGEIDIEITPVQMVRLRKLNIDQFANGNILEPGKVLEGHKEFLVSNQEPKTMFRHVCNFNCRNGLPKPRGFHLRAPE